MDARAEWESAKRGAIDGFFESTGLDYFVGGTYGPIEGHQQAYSKGYAVGMAAGIGVTIAAGFVTGGATIGACTANIARIGVTAARVFNMAGMMGGELLHHPIRSLLPSPRLRGEGLGVRSLQLELIQVTHHG